MSSSRLIVRKRLSSLGHTCLKLHGYRVVYSPSMDWPIECKTGKHFFTLKSSNLIDE